MQTNDVSATHTSISSHSHRTTYNYATEGDIGLGTDRRQKEETESILVDLDGENLKDNFTEKDHMQKQNKYSANSTRNHHGTRNTVSSDQEMIDYTFDKSEQNSDNNLSSNTERRLSFDSELEDPLSMYNSSIQSREFHDLNFRNEKERKQNERCFERTRNEFFNFLSTRLVKNVLCISFCQL